MIKKLIFITLALFAAMTLSVTVSAASEDETDRVLDSQLGAVNGEALYDSLPPGTKERLSRLGITSLDHDGIKAIDMGSAAEQIISMLTEGSRTPLCGVTACMGLILLCAMTEGFQLGGSDRRLGAVQDAVGTLCICAAVIVPMSATIGRVSEVIGGASALMLVYAPIMAGLMISSGSEVTGASYYTAMMTAGNAVSLTASRLVIPMMNGFLALSVTSSLSPGLKLDSLCDSVYKTAKWALTFVMSIFITVMTLNTIVTTSMDNVSKKALRFTVSSFVPVVGGVLGDAIGTFSGSLELLRSGAGVFVIIAAAMILLPVLAECILWQISLFLLFSVSEVAGVGRMGGVFRTLSKAAGMMTALLLCVMVVFIITTVIVLLAGRS